MEAQSEENSAAVAVAEDEGTDSVGKYDNSKMTPEAQAAVAAVVAVLPPRLDALATAMDLLDQCNWDPNAAVNRYYTVGAPELHCPDTKASPLLAPPSVCSTYSGSVGAKRPVQSRLSMGKSASRTETSGKRSLVSPSSSGSGAAAAAEASSMRTPKQPRVSCNEPLAERVRPAALTDIVGQKALRPDSALAKLLQEDRFPSVVLWGPPGCGKTTMAGVVARATKKHFVKLSATAAGVKEVRTIVEEAQGRRRFGQATLLFLDEIHRWNKSQQDALLPHVESGLITLVGATTENPSFSLNSALLSRCRVVVLNKLGSDDIKSILLAALRNPASGLPQNVDVPDDVIGGLAAAADGDARAALNALEFAVSISTDPSAPAGTPVVVSSDAVREGLQKSHLLYDRAGDQHYNIISALHKSMRGGDVDAALYWLARMLESGEDARYVTRRLVRFASEDIGLADPGALLQATAAHTAAERLGMPECDVIIAQCVAYLAMAPKSVAVYKAYGTAKNLVKNAAADPVPLHICNAPTGLMKDLGYGAGYKYTPDSGYSRGPPEGMSYFPDSLSGTVLFDPSDVEPGHKLHVPTGDVN